MKQALKKLTPFYPKYLDVAIDQLKDYFKIYWISIPATNDYKSDNERIERLLSGIKNYRNFSQLNEIGRKCAINGEYNVTIFKKAEKENLPIWLDYTLNVEVYESNSDRISLKILSPGEGLCTMNFYKRIYLDQKKSEFDATCQIAYLDAVALIDDESINKELKNLQNIDEQYLYKDAIIKKNEDLKKVIYYQKKVLDYFQEKGIRVAKYYAVLVFDVDLMGRWLSGEFLESEKDDQLHFQKRLSDLFSDFARFAKDYVDGRSQIGIPKKGQTIYAGGDDFLGLINLSYLSDVLTKLIAEFQRIVWDEGLKKEFTFRPDAEPMTFSAGIAIAHYKTPLSYVISEARNAEKNAKHEKGGNRNAVSITVLKRSGEIHKTTFKREFIKDMFEIVRALRIKVSSNKFITSFSEEFLPIVNDNNFIFSDIFETEIGRLLNDNKVPEIRQHVLTLLRAFLKDNDHLQEFIYLLNIADFISREIGELK